MSAALRNGNGICQVRQESKSILGFVWPRMGAEDVHGSSGCGCCQVWAVWCLWSLSSQGKAEGRREAATAAGEDNSGCFKLLAPELGELEGELSSFFLSISGQSILTKLSLLWVVVWVGFFWLSNVFLSGAVRSKLLGYMNSD